MFQKRFFLVVLLLSLVGLLLMASVQGVGSTLKFGLSSDPPTLNPHFSGGTSARTVKLTVYEGLVGYTPDGETTLLLAETLDITDPTTYTFHLRPGVRFHGGENLTSADVAYTFRRILDPETGSYLRGTLSVIEEIETPDELTVVFRIKEPFTPFIEVLAQAEASIVSESWMEGAPDLDASMNGTGPFQLGERIPGVEIAMVKNDDYYIEGLPKVDSIRFIIYADADARLSALLTHEVDLIEYVEWRQIATIEGDPAFVVDLEPSLFQVLSINVSEEPFSNPRVRQAISYAINREEIVAACFEGHAQPLYGALIPQGHWAYNEDLANYFEYNVQKAKELLAEAGYPDGFSCSLLATSAYSTHWCPAEVIQGQLAKVGIEVELDLVDWPTRVETRSNWNYQFASDGLSGDYLDPDFYFKYFYSKGSPYVRPPYFDDLVVNDLLTRGRAALDREERKVIYRDLEKRLLDESPWIFLVRREQPYAYHSRVSGFEQLPSFLTPYSGVTLKYVEVEE
jgi:glutathione transport system substrate-binding protein